MTSYYCPKCKEGKINFQYANPYNSTKFCCDCGTALETTNIKPTENSESSYAFISKGLYNAINKMFKEE